MKKLILVVMLALASPTFEGCSTTQRQEIALKTLQATALTVDKAMQALADAWKYGQDNPGKGLVDHETLDKIHVWHDRYRALMQSALERADGLLTVEPDPELAGVATQIVRGVALATKGVKL